MTAKYYTEKYPWLCKHAAKMVSAMESECQTRGKIFDKLAEIFAEYSECTQLECAAVLTCAMQRIYNGFMNKSTQKRNQLRSEFKKEFFEKFFKQCKEARLDEVLVTHMACALRAVWRNIELHLADYNCRAEFYNTNLKKFSRRFTM